MEIVSDGSVRTGSGSITGTAYSLSSKLLTIIGFDLTDEYISVGKKLTDLVGLSDRVELHQGSALEIPFDDEEFDIVWTEHVQMNIADKNRFYIC